MKAFTKLIAILVIGTLCLAQLTVTKQGNHVLSYLASREDFVKTFEAEFISHFGVLDLSSFPAFDLVYKDRIDDNLLQINSIQLVHSSLDDSAKLSASYNNGLYTLTSDKLEQAIVFKVNYSFTKNSKVQDYKAVCIADFADVVFTKKVDSNQKIVTSFDAIVNGVNCLQTAYKIQLQNALTKAALAEPNVTPYTTKLVDFLELGLMNSYKRSSGVNLDINISSGNKLSLNLSGNNVLDRGSNLYLQVFDGQFSTRTASSNRSPTFFNFNINESKRQLAVHESLLQDIFNEKLSKTFKPIVIRQNNSIFKKTNFKFTVQYLSAYIPDVLKKFPPKAKTFVSVSYAGEQTIFDQIVPSFNIVIKTDDATQENIVTINVVFITKNFFENKDSVALNNNKLLLKLNSSNFDNFVLTFSGLKVTKPAGFKRDLLVAISEFIDNSAPVATDSLSFHSVFGSFDTLRLSKDKKYIILQDTGKTVKNSNSTRDEIIKQAELFYLN